MYITIYQALVQPLIIFLSCLGVGLLILRLWAPGFSDLKSLLFLGISLGSGAIAVYGLAAAFGGLVYPLTFWLVVAVGLFGVFYCRGELYAAGKSTLKVIFQEANVTTNCLLIILFVLYYNFFLASLAPVIAGDAYKYEISKLIVKHHKMVVRPELLLSDMPNLLGMLFVFSQSLFNFDSIKIVCLILGSVFCLGSYTLARRYLSREGALITAILITLIPPFYHELYEPNIDVGWSLWGLGGIYLILHFLDNRCKQVGPYILVGFLLGCTASGKQFAPIITLAVILLILLPFKLQQFAFPFRARLKLGTIIGLTAFVVVLPWYLKSYFYTGDPFYPYGSTIFRITSEFLSPEAASRVFTITAKYDPLSYNPWRILLFPVFWTFPILYKPHEPFWIHPFIIIFLPLYILISKSANIRDNRLWFLAATIAIPIVIISPLIRFSYIPITILTIIAIGVYENLASKYNVRNSFFVVLAIYLIFSLGTIFHKTNHTLAYTLGLLNKKEYMLKYSPRWANNPNIRLELWLAENTPPDAKILISGLSGWMGFFADRQRWDMYNLETYLKWHKLDTSDETLIKVLKDRGLQFIVLYGTHLDNFYLCQQFVKMYREGKLKKVYVADHKTKDGEISHIFQVY